MTADIMYRTGILDASCQSSPPVSHHLLSVSTPFSQHFLSVSISCRSVLLVSQHFLSDITSCQSAPPVGQHFLSVSTSISVSTSFRSAFPVGQHFLSVITSCQPSSQQLYITVASSCSLFQARSQNYKKRFISFVMSVRPSVSLSSNMQQLGSSSSLDSHR